MGIHNHVKSLDSGKMSEEELNNYIVGVLANNGDPEFDNRGLFINNLDAIGYNTAYKERRIRFREKKNKSYNNKAPTTDNNNRKTYFNNDNKENKSKNNPNKRTYNNNQNNNQMNNQTNYNQNFQNKENYKPTNTNFKREQNQD